MEALWKYKALYANKAISPLLPSPTLLLSPYLSSLFLLVFSHHQCHCTDLHTQVKLIKTNFFALCSMLLCSTDCISFIAQRLLVGFGQWEGGPAGDWQAGGERGQGIYSLRTFSASFFWVSLICLGLSNKEHDFCGVLSGAGIGFSNLSNSCYTLPLQG